VTDIEEGCSTWKQLLKHAFISIGESIRFAASAQAQGRIRSKNTTETRFKSENKVYNDDFTWAVASD
jgi:hypothetical protein